MEMQCNLPSDSILPRFRVVPYQKQYAAQISLLFHLAVQGISSRHYSDAQLKAWSYQPRSSRYWHLRLSRSQTWVVLDFAPIKPLAAPLCCGFINVETHYFSRGYIDSLYLHPAYQGKGLARALFATAKKWAKQQGYPELTVDASYLSRPLFESGGFELCYKSYQPKSGQMLPGFFMRCQLHSASE